MPVTPRCIATTAACLLLITLSCDAAPQITEAPRKQKVVDGGIVSLVCRATGNPLPEIYWYRAGRRLSNGGQRHAVLDIPGGSLLRIEPVKKRRDEGVIECVADNEVEDPATAAANIDVYTSGTAPAGYPRIVENPMIKAVENGRNTSMICSASGTPEPTISWLKDRVPVDLTDARLRILPTGSLRITGSLETDEGRYECIAANSLGVAYSYSANLYVRVRRVPPHFTIVPENVEVTPGGAVNLTCIAVGSPMPVVKWRLGAVELTPADGAPYGKNVLMLTDIRETATYTCVATSEHYGSIKYDTEVKVKDL